MVYTELGDLADRLAGGRPKTISRDSGSQQTSTRLPFVRGERRRSDENAKYQLGLGQRITSVDTQRPKLRAGTHPRPKPEARKTSTTIELESAVEPEALDAGKPRTFTR